MKLLNNKLITVSFIIFTVFLYFLLSVYIKISPGYVNSSMWKGFYTLVLSEDAPVRSIVSDLQKIGGWDVLSEYNSEVTVFNYNKNSSIPVYKLKDFYVEGDSLYDPFLQKLPLLFVGKSLTENYHIVYVNSTMESKLFLGKITKIMESYSEDWFLPDIQIQHQIIVFIIFFLSIFALLLWHKDLWPLLLTGLFPWVQFLFGTGVSGLIVSILFIISLELLGIQLYPSFKQYLNLGIFYPLDKKKLSISIIILLISFIYAIVNLHAVSIVISFFIAVFVHLLAVICYLFLLAYKRRLQQHRIFFPVKIKFHRHKLKRKDLYIFSLLVLFMLFTPLIQQEDKFNNNIILPVPLKLEGINDFSILSMEILNSHSISSELPNLSDYISHLMFLTTYPYGFEYSFPQPDTKITVPQFTKNGNTVLEKNISIFMFTDSWYQSIINENLSLDVVRLFLSQDSPVLVSYKSGSGMVSTGKIKHNHYWFSIIFLFAFVLFFSDMSRINVYFVKEFLLRRKRQVV